jgi:hypothetical protein
MLTISPNELDMLQRVFERECELRSIGRNQREADDLAALVVALYQQGIRDESRLDDMLTQHDRL